MLNRLLIELFKSPNNGRQIAILPSGRRLLLTHSGVSGPAELRLWGAKQPAAASVRGDSTTPASLSDFEDLGPLVGISGAVPDGGPWGFGGSLIRARDSLHLSWTSPHGVAYSSAKVSDKPDWSPAESVCPGECLLGDLFAVGGQVALTYQQTHDRQTESVGMAWLDGKWKTKEVDRGKPVFAPVADVDQSGRVHLVWSDPAEQLHYARLDELGAEAHIELLGAGRQPSILCRGDQVLIACESEYGHIRYYYRSEKTPWRKYLPLTTTDPWLTSDENHSPGLTRDRHGVVWLLFANNTRQSTFWSRWMGDRWGDIVNGPRIYYRRPRFDANLLPVGRLSVEKRSDAHTARPQEEDLGLLLACEPPIRRLEYRCEKVPELTLTPSRKILFLDMLEVAEARNVSLHVETATKHPANPLMERGPEGAFDQDRVFNHGCVLLDGGKYRMWYGGIREPRGGEPRPPWYDWIRCGYAESDDGIHWKRVKTRQVEWRGSRDNNILPFFRHSPLIFRDDAEPDPRRRYKAFYFWNSGEHLDIARSGKYGKTWDPRDERFLMDLFTSADGIHFERQEGEVVFPGEQARPLSLIPQSIFRDEREPDPQKRFKGYGFSSLDLRRRGTSYIWSPDCLHWTAHPELPVIDPAIRGTPPAAGGPTGQVHDTVCFPYEGYYIALYQDQHDPLNMPVELAVSRDSESFRLVLPGHKVIPVGSENEWDALTILPTTPVFRDDEIRLYYGGGTERREAGGAKRWQTLPGLATLRRDGFTSIRLDVKQCRGELTTIPFQLPDQRHQLHLNALCPSGSELRVELLDASTGKSLPGFSSEDCHPIQGDHLDTMVKWRGQEMPNRRVRLRFQFRGADQSPRLYAFWF